MKQSELIKILKNSGGTVLRHGSRHDIWIMPSGKTITVPRHKKEIPSGTAKEILKQAGL